MPPDNILDGVLQDFTAAANSFYPLILLYAVRILAAIVTLQICYLSIQAALRWDLMGMFEAFFLGFVRIALVWAVMDHLWDWANGFINTAEEIGADVSGQSPSTLTPSGVYNLGLHIISTLYGARSFGMWFHLIDDIVFMVVTLATQITFAAVGLVYLWTLLEALYHIAKGPIVLCWTAFDLTWEVLARWGERLLGLSLKVLSMLLMLAVGITLTGKWSTYLSGVGLGINDHRVFYAVLALIESLAFFAGVWIVPRMAASNIHAQLGGAGGGEAGAASMWEMGKSAGGAAAGGAVVAGKGGYQLGKYIQGKLRS
jgi:P-type conjugative transfer protein TrbL